ncbi:MAG: 3-isopropylmalate dehydratase [Sulfurospirillaceae bacterium]|nr:3-isopropylmalate dehydratase [Sulfurospirillaceae bacterium]
MKPILMGKAFLFGNNIDTDQIYPGRFVELTDAKDIAQYAMHGVDPEFITKVRDGDIIVAGTNFGCGSSREHAAITLKEVGIGAIIAESFARIFYRNAINLGLPLFICPHISTLIQHNDRVSIDVFTGVISNASGPLAKAEPLSEYVVHILESGGIKPLVKQQLEERS